MGLYDKPESFKPLHWFWIFGLGVLYAVYTALSWSLAYLDFGDGNYMYISWRLAQGAVVYRDILAPQPPCHLFLGAGLVWLGRLIERLFGLGGDPLNTVNLYVFRSFSLLLHLANYALVMRLAWRAWGRPLTIVLAGGIFLWLPLNYWWAMGYQSEPLEIFFLLAMMACALRVTPRGDLWAGIFAGLAGLTNATAAPFLLVLIVYMLARAPRRALRMTVPCVLLVGVVAGLLQCWTAGKFLQNTVTNQVGTYPNESVQAFINYAVGKLVSQGQGVMILEGGFVVLALVGFWRYLSTSPLDAVSCGGLAWFCLATLGSLIYVTKGGTEDYIFSLAGPAVAILSAGELAAWIRRWQNPLPEVRSGWIVRTIPFGGAKAVAVLLLAGFMLGPGLAFYGRLSDQSHFELTSDEAERVFHQIERLSKPRDLILAPPYYAFMTRRRIWDDYSELFIWQCKYWNDRKENNPRGEGWSEVRAMAEALEDRQIALVMLEMDQTGKFSEVMAALQAHYVPIESPLAGSGRPAYILKTKNTHLGLFVPLASDAPEALAEQHERWQAFKFDMMRHYGVEGVRLNFRWYDLPLTVAGAPAEPTPAPAQPVATPAATPTATPTPAPTPTPEPARIAPILKKHPATTHTLPATHTLPTTRPAATATATPAPPRPAMPTPLRSTPTPTPTPTLTPTATATPRPRPEAASTTRTQPGPAAHPVLPLPGYTSQTLPAPGPQGAALATSPTLTPTPRPRRHRPSPERIYFGRE